MNTPEGAKKLVSLPVAWSKQSVEGSVHWGPWIGILMITSLFAMAYSSLMILTADSATRNWPMEISISSLVWLLVYFIATLKQFRSVYLLTTSYVLTLVLFHLGVTVPGGLGFFGDIDLRADPIAKWLELSGWSTLLALGSLGFGFSLGLRRSDFEVDKHRVDGELANTALGTLYADGIGLLLASTIGLGLAIASFGNLLNYSRVDFFRGVGDTRGLGIFLMTLPAAITAMVIGANTPMRRRLAFGIATAGLVLVLLSGYRSTAMFPLIVGIALWVKTGRRISIVFAAGTIAFSIVAISAAGLLRNVRAYKDIDSQVLSASVQQSTTQDAIVTMGSTGAVLANVIRLVPEQDPYRFGQSYWAALLLSLPNILPQMRESTRAAGLGGGAMNADAVNEMIPSDWITYRLKPDKFAVGEGVGFTGIGEPYINFGYPGVVAFFLLLGYAFARMECAILLRRPLLVLFCSTMLWALISTVRQDIGNFFKPVVFISIILLGWRMIGRLGIRP
jgi:oligosaccharide repeat unit polymerase